MREYKRSDTDSKGGMLIREGKSVYNLKDRTFLFAKRIIEIAEMIPVNPTSNIIRVQLIKAGTSVGANIEEADGSFTKPDFRNKMVIARKEAREANYWLRLITGKYMTPEELSQDIKESIELIKIFSSIISKVKA
jgi:four helix bundle protein